VKQQEEIVRRDFSRAPKATAGFAENGSVRGRQRLSHDHGCHGGFSG